MSKEYDNYLNKHIHNVKVALGWLLENLPEVTQGFDPDYLGHLISIHDKSKWGPEEYEAYDKKFYSNEDVEEQFDRAWLHHQKHNPHHWQYWVLPKDDGSTKAIEMTEEAVIEMFCDHWSFSWEKGNLYEIFDWYEENRSKMILNEKTRNFYEYILEKLKERLDEVNNVQ